MIFLPLTLSYDTDQCLNGNTTNVKNIILTSFKYQEGVEGKETLTLSS